MRRCICLALFLISCGDDDGSSTPDGGTSGTEKRLIFLHTNDEHSHLFAYGPEVDDFRMAQNPALVGGIARRATALAAERAAATTAGIDVVTVSAGDESQGALPQVAFATTAPDLTVTKKLGYDIIIPGNHEFDNGPKAYADAIKAAMTNGGIPQIVSTNIKLNGEPNLTPLFGEGTSSAVIKRYHVMTTAKGIKIGFLAVMGTEASYNAPYKTPVAFSGTREDDAAGNLPASLPALFADLRPTVTALRDTEKVDIVVLVSHGGVNLVDPTLGDDYQIAKNVAGIDLIIGGHSHDALAAPQLVANAQDGHMVPIVQAGAYGNYLGRVEMVLKPGQRPTVEMDPQKSKLILLDSSVTANRAAVQDILDGVVRDLETRKVEGNKSFLEAALGRIEGAPVTDNAGMLGDLYFRKMAQTTFNVVGMRRSVETNVLNLSTDAMLAAMDELGLPTVAAIQAGGTVRADIDKGATGELTFADLFRSFPLGGDIRDQSVGYPLVRGYIFTAELKAGLEIAAAAGLTRDQLFLVAAGVRAEFDTNRAPQVLSSAIDALNPQNGRITKMLVDTTHGNGYEDPSTVMFDITAAGGFSSAYNGLALQPVVTSLYIADLAGAFGLRLKDDHGVEHPNVDFIVRRPDNSEVRDYEAWISYIRKQSQLNGGNLPARYDESRAEGHLPRRMICAGPLCPAAQ